MENLAFTFSPVVTETMKRKQNLNAIKKKPDKERLTSLLQAALSKSTRKCKAQNCAKQEKVKKSKKLEGKKI